jgi:predicted aspartyl protease
MKYNGLSAVLACKVLVSQAFDPNAKIARPTQTEFLAIWDTGATNTVITEKVVNTCGLKPIGMARVNTVNGQADCPVFLINLFLPSNVGFHHVRVTLGQLIGADMLIGMDIITKGDFVVTNKDSKTAFSFRMPSCQCIDFVQEIKEAKALAGQPIKVPAKIGRNAPCPCGSGKKYKHCCGR